MPKPFELFHFNRTPTSCTGAVRTNVPSFQEYLATVLMISNNGGLEDKSYPKEVTKYLDYRFKSIESFDAIGLAVRSKQ